MAGGMRAEQPFTLREKTVTLCTRRILNGSGTTGISSLWKAWVKEYPALHEANRDKEAAIAALELSIAILYDELP